MAEYIRKEYRDLNEVASDNNDDHDDDVNNKDVGVVEIIRGEALKMPDMLVNLK